MRLLFAAGDVGGARALLPVAREAVLRGHAVSALAHGVLRSEGADAWNWLDQADAEAYACDADLLVYATSVADTAALRVAQAARAAGRPCLHVLDNWCSYAQRIVSLVPEAYAVMDGLARREALDAGVPGGILHVTGHPGLATLSQERASLPAPRRAPVLLFVSEPSRQDNGAGVLGYDEVLVTDALVAALVECAPPGTVLHVAPHPREDRDAVFERVQAACEAWAGASQAPASLDWKPVPTHGVRRALHAATHVVGMSSILLYEAWLLGRCTLSLQPGLCCEGPTALSRRDGLAWHHERTGIDRAVTAWLDRAPTSPSPDLDTHLKAAGNVLELARRLVEARCRHTPMPHA